MADTIEVLDSNDVLRGVLAGAVASTQPNVTIIWADQSDAEEHATRTAFNSTTVVSFLAGATVKRLVKKVIVYNGDTAAVTLTLDTYHDGATQRIHCKTTIQTGETFVFDANGVKVFTTAGALRQTDTALGSTSVAVTATADGTGTGTIPEGGMDMFAAVTSASADNIVILPAPTPGRKVTLHVAATGYELRSSSPTTIAINGGTGSAAESAIGANTTVYAVCGSATSWKAWQSGSDGTLAATQAAAP